MNPTIQSLTSFSGADLIVSFANQVIGELQLIHWAIQREKAPNYTFGSADPRSFSRGKRAIAGQLGFLVYDHDSMISAMQRVWDKLAPPAMFTAAGNVSVSNSENFLNAVDILKWNVKATEATFIGANGNPATTNGNFGYSGTTPITSNKTAGSNDKPVIGSDGYFVDGWQNSDDEINVPPGFSPIRGENIVYADQIPPFDVSLTFGNEYGQAAFQKLYDVEILNDASGANVDNIVMERQMTFIARKISPLIRGIYNREEGGNIKGIAPYESN